MSMAFHKSRISRVIWASGHHAQRCADDRC